MKWIPIVALTLSSLHAKEFETYFHQPSFSDKTLSTYQGGIVRGDNFRIQAREIRVGKEEEGTVLHARGDIAFLYQGNLLIADTLTYNLSTHSGIAENGKTVRGFWYIGADQIEIKPSGGIVAKQAHVTPEDSFQYVFSFNAKEMEIGPRGELETSGVTFRVKNIPIFYFPAFATSLNRNEDPLVSYSLDWISGQGPQLDIKYKLFSNDTTSFHARADIRPKRGFGGAIETKTNVSKGQFNTKSYLAHDTFYRDNNPNRKRTRFRLQGGGDFTTEQSLVHISYDKISDRNMPYDFPSNSFEYDATRATELGFYFDAPIGTVGTIVEPRINSFQGYVQHLPTGFFHSLPYQFAETPIYFQTDAYGSFLKFTPAKFVVQDTPGFDSGRIESESKIYGTATFQSLRFSPYVGYDAIFYSASPQGKERFVFSGIYGGILASDWRRSYESMSHTISPFIAMTGYTKPAINPSDRYIFSVRDGIDRISELESGISNTFAFTTGDSIIWDTSLLSFLGQSTLPDTFPKGKLSLHGAFGMADVIQEGVWNFSYQNLDFVRSALLWTLTDDIAIGVEYQHRGKYYWRKDAYDNYILDVTVPASQLLNTPISEGENVLLTKAQFRFDDLWWLRFQSHNGWGRTSEKSYYEYKAELFTQVTTHWRASGYFAMTTLGPQFGAELHITK